MKIEFRDGLLFTSIQISFRGSTRVIDNVVIDTGAAESIISPDAVEDIGIFAEPEDSVNSFYGVGGSLHNFFSKNVDEIKLGQVKLDEIPRDRNGEFELRIIGKYEKTLHVHRNMPMA